MQLALQSRLEILAHFSGIPHQFDSILNLYAIRLYGEMLAFKLQTPQTSQLNSVCFLTACHSLQRLIGKELAAGSSPDFAKAHKVLKQISWMIDQGIIGV